MDNMSVADIAAVTDRDGGFSGGNSAIWLFALLILFGMGGFGGFGNRFGSERCATVEDINNSANFTRLESQVQANSQAIQQGFTNLGNGICDLGYELADKFGQTNTAMQVGFCGLDKSIMESRYLNEKATSDSTAAIISAINALGTKMDANTIESLRSQVNDLKTQSYLCGVPRVNPYGYGIYPYPTCNTCCNNNI